MADKKIVLKNPSELKYLIDRPQPFKDKLIIEYIDLLHNTLMDYQLFMDVIKHNIEIDDRDIKYSLI